jgi:hypothetical protein
MCRAAIVALWVVTIVMTSVGCNKSGGNKDGDAGASDTKHPQPLATDPDPVVLLHTVDATVAVSSKVDNPRDYPEHLVDGKADTAWNGKTGDLTGWIAFRVPKTAKVVRVELTPGFDKTSAKGDLFTMNHRIKKVKITRQGQLLKEATLDVQKRALQAIDIDAPGGDFRVDVLETVAGTEKTWRELTVSEFRVWGRAGGAPETAEHLPKMAIGSLDGRPPPRPSAKTDPPRGPFATFAELCTAYDKVLTPLMDAKFTDDAYPGKIPAPHCAAKTMPKGFVGTQLKRAPFKDGIFVTLDDMEQQRSVLLLETAKGWYRTDVRVWSRSFMDPGCLHGSSELFEDVTWPTTSTGQDVAVIRIVNRDVRWAQMQEQVNGADSKEIVYVCRVDAQGAAACEGPRTLATAHEPLPPTFDPGQQAFYEINVDKIPWTSRKKPVIGPAGDLRLE